MNIDDLPTVRPREIVLIGPPPPLFYIAIADGKVKKILEYSYIVNWSMDQLKAHHLHQLIFYYLNGAHHLIKSLLYFNPIRTGVFWGQS